MKRYEKESFFKVFGIFFSTLLVLCVTIFTLYYEESSDHLKDDILYQMREYVFDFKGDKFSLEFVEKQKSIKFSVIATCKEGLCAYFHTPKDDKFILKVAYAQKSFERDLTILKVKILKIFAVVFLVILFFSLYFAVYSLRPMKNAIELLEVFLKDLIHDLNTPVTSILLNVKLLGRKGLSPELERIELSAKTISSLHKNLENLKDEVKLETTSIDLQRLIEERIEILEKLYPKIKFIKKLESLHVHSDEDALSRIIDNILTNACKYNKKNGEVLIRSGKNVVSIEDTGVGIANPKRVFERYYKENERGLGLGMNIVKRLCDELGIDITLHSELDKGTIVKLTFN